MKTALRYILIVLAIFISSPLYAVSLDELVKLYRNSVVYIKVQKISPANGAITEEHGTGFVVNKEGFVLTAGHVVAGGAGVQVDVRGIVGSSEGTSEGMEVLFENTNIDVALLRFKNTAISRKPIPLGDPWFVSDSATVYSMGFPGNEEWFHTEGKLNGKVGPKGSWNTTLTLNPGMSGGPVFDIDGRVIAIVWGGVSTVGVTGINRILPVNLLVDPLRFAGIASTQTNSSPSIPSNTVPPQPTKGVEVPYKIDETQESLGGLQAASKDYQRTFQAWPGYVIVDYKFVAKSSNNANVASVQVSPDKKTLNVVFSLKSGPVFDRWRGWLDADILTRQERE